jgi:ABC-type transport system involved in cytochrome bd biosynthesis fused ATPase/permease subunit
VVAVLPPHGHWWGFVVVLVLSQVIAVVALAKLATAELRDDRLLRAARGHFRAQLVELSSAVPTMALLQRTSLAESRIALVAHDVQRAEARLRRHRRGSSAVVVVASLLALSAVVEHPRTSSVWLVVGAVIALATYDALVALRAALSAAVEVSGGGERLESLEAALTPSTNLWPSASAVRLTNVDVIEGDQTLLRDATIQVEGGARVALIGESGVGKSTLLRTMAGLDPTSGGVVFVGGVDVRTIAEADLRRYLAYVTSEPGFTRGYAHDVLSLGRAGTRDALGDLATLGLVVEHSTRFDELSRGEAARVAVARALFTSPQIVLLDEPTAGLGHDETAAVLRLLETVGATVIIATHDDQVIEWCEVVVELRERELHVLRR